MTCADEPKYPGGCLCGQVRYAFSAEPLQVAICHCRHCQKNTGSAFSVNAVFPEDSAAVTGELAVFEDAGDSGHPVLRLFCARCGTPIRSMAEQTRGLFVLKAGTLDDPGCVVPTNEVYCDRHIEAWVLTGRSQQR